MSKPINKFARDEEYESAEYKKISQEMLKIFEKTTKIDLKILDGKEQYVDGMGFSRYWEYPWAIINSKVSKNMKVLDVGCGRAPFIKYLGKVIGCETYGIDYDGSGCIEDGLWGCDEGFDKEYNVTIKKADAREKLPFEDEEFDRVFCINVLETMNNGNEVSKAVKEMVRVLKSNGLLIITVADGIFRKDIEEAAGIPYYGECDFSLPNHRKPHNILGMMFIKEKEKSTPAPPKKEKEKLKKKVSGKRQKKSLKERLVAINGIDEKIAKEILEEYKTLDGIKKAIKDNTFSVGGVGPKKKAILLHLKS